MAMNWPVQQQGATGEDVRTLQYLLDEAGATVGVDGTFGRVTKEAVRAFQADHGLTVDGIAGDATWAALAIPIKLNSTGHAVRAAQRQIRRRAGRLLIDGVFHARTEAAVRSFQGCVGQTENGVVGPQTWNALVSGYFISDDGEAAALQTFMAWRDNDQATAKKNAAPGAVDVLFKRRWRKADGWVFGSCDFVKGGYTCNWSRSGETLVLDANDNADQPFYFVATATFSSDAGD